MDFNFELLLFLAVNITGLLALCGLAFTKHKLKNSQHPKLTMIFNFGRSFFPLLLIVFSFRSFGYEPRHIPSGSLEPTLLIGDLILVNKFNYGIRLPVIHTKVFSLNTPKRGDIVVFRRPTKPSLDLIKRVIGVPGDHISYVNKILYINGHKSEQQFEKYTIDDDTNSASWTVEQKQETLVNLKHEIYQIPEAISDDFFDVVVPPGKYFMMGDNRDSSADSRAWGFMPEENIIGQATHILISIDSLKHPLRLERTAQKII